MLLWAGQSVQLLCFGRDSHYIDVAVGWTVSTVTVMWAGQSLQRCSCVLDSQNSDCVLGSKVIAMLLWTQQSVQLLCFRLNCHYSDVAVG